MLGKLASGDGVTVTRIEARAELAPRVGFEAGLTGNLALDLDLASTTGEGAAGEAVDHPIRDYRRSIPAVPSAKLKTFDGSR